jgi:hypothetical protein
LGSATVPVAVFGVSPDAFFRPVAFLSRFTRHLSLFVRTFAEFCGVSLRCSNKCGNTPLRVLTRFNANFHLAPSQKSSLSMNFSILTAEFKNRNVARKQKANRFEPFLHLTLRRLLMFFDIWKILERGSLHPDNVVPMKLLFRFSALLLLCTLTASADPIDRHAVVSRHDVVLTNFDATNPLSVGNGGFCFTVDATGLQTFSDAFEKTTPLGTLSDWGWHTFPNPHNWSIDTFQFTDFTNLYGRPVPYADVPHNKTSPEISWLRENPHRLDLGRIGFALKHADGSPATPADLTDVRQTLDLWDGQILSHFKFDGEPVDVETVCAPDRDGIAVRVVSPLAAEGRLAIEIAFPYGTGDMKTADWDHPEAHQTMLSQLDPNHTLFYRRLDNDSYYTMVLWTNGATLTNIAQHTYDILPAPKSDALDLVCVFSPTNFDTVSVPTFARTVVAARKHWNKFWKTGGIIDLYGSTDPRWFELERRIVLSEYLTAIQTPANILRRKRG